MPATSVSQRRFFGWAEHHPDEAKSEGKYPKGMTKSAMHDFASTSEHGLPEYAADGVPASGGLHWLGHDADGSGADSVYPRAHYLDGVFHKFAKTTDAPMQEDGKPPVHRWIQGVVNSSHFKKGALTAQAHSAGETPMQFAHQHAHDTGKTGARSRFALNVNK